MTERYTAAIRNRLADLYGLHQQTQAVERKILESAEQRLDVVNEEIDKLSPRALTDDAVAERYQALILERGRLHQVIAMAKEHLK